MKTTRQIRSEGFYRNAMVVAMRALLLIMNPQDQANYPFKYEELVEYTLSWLKTELEEVAEAPARRDPTPQGSGLSLDDEA